MVVSGTFFVREKNRITGYTTVAFFNVKCFNGICSIEVYEDVEEFLEKSGWRRDNPELCSECGKIKKELKLSERVYRCTCGNEMDRDRNAAINIREEARRMLAA